jgi:hypothetical protein
LAEPLQNIATYLREHPILAAVLLATMSVLLELWLKVNSRKRSPSGGLLVRDDAMLWPSWVVSSGVTGATFFFSQDVVQAGDEAGMRVLIFAVCILAGCAGPPFLAREYGTRLIPAGPGHAQARELTFWCGIVWPNAIGLLILTAVVYSGLSNSAG